LKTIDIITSALNEQECLPELIFRIKKVMAKEKSYSYRLMIMDNGSDDSTWSVITREAKNDKRIIGYKMSRTFSLDAAFTNGINQSSADLVIIMCSDLQDPPEIIPDLLRKYEGGGVDQVLVKITSRDQLSFARKKLTKLFYRVAKYMTNGLIPESVSDFRLMNRRSYEAFQQMPETNRFFRGLTSWIGFNSTTIEIQRPDRFAGDSKFVKTSIITALGFGAKGILAYSKKPLNAISFFGFVMSLLGVVTLFTLSILWIYHGVPFAGYGSILGVMFIGFSIVLLCLGVLAAYMGLIYDEVKRRPLYIVSDVTNESRRYR
jgi:polyisoprenyl-phosphate glycosyltransferase